MTTESLLQDILRLHNPDGAFAYAVGDSSTREATLTGANETLCAMLGYDHDELAALSPADIVEDFADLTGNEFGPFETRNELVEHTLISKNGERIPVEIRSHVLHLSESDMNVVTVLDNTRRIRTRQGQEQGQKCFRMLYEMSKKFDEPEQAILDYALAKCLDITGSETGYIYFMNADQTEMTLHARSDDLMRNSANKNLSVKCKVSEAGIWGEAARQRQPIITNNCPADPDRQNFPGYHVPIKRHMNLPIIDNGRIVLIAGMANKKEDYTETDVAYVSLPMDGVWRIVQRKRMEEDIVKAMTDAERANKAKSQFLANMSHELRTPLNGIMGMTQLLLGTEVTNEQKEYLTLSMEASLHLSKVMTSLLDLSSIETGAVALAPINFNLPDTLESLIKPLTLQAADKSLILLHEIGPDVPVLINGDEKKLRQILINLIYNAIKFTETGEVVLTVKRTATTTGLLGDMAELRFTVTDTGIGIPEDKLESIFEKFVLGEDYLTKRYGGTGLGLSISRELATAMGGKITVQSLPNHGSAFTLTLPFLLRDAKGGSCAISDPSISPSKPLNILVAEDEQVNALVTSGILKKNGHTVTVVSNGQHAIDILMKKTFDVVLMDVQMPVINGLEVTEIIRRGAAENVPHDIPIIGLTAYATDADRKLCLDAGMDSVVTKPFEASDLLMAICLATTA